MAAHIIAEIYRRVETSHAESTILQVIAYAANVQGQNSKIAFDAIAQRAGYSQRWTIIIIQRLEAKCLLRVHRHRLGYAIHDVNRYDIVRPWLRDVSMRELYKRKASSIRPSERFVQRAESKEKTKETGDANRKEEVIFATHEECINLGLTPGSIPYNCARGLPTEEKGDKEAKPQALHPGFINPQT